MPPTRRLAETESCAADPSAPPAGQQDVTEHHVLTSVSEDPVASTNDGGGFAYTQRSEHREGPFKRSLVTVGVLVLTSLRDKPAVNMQRSCYLLIIALANKHLLMGLCLCCTSSSANEAHK